MKNRDIYWRRYKIQEAYIGQWCLSPLQSGHLGTSHSSPNISSAVQNTLQNPLLESPSAAPLYFPESHQWYEISSLSKVILVLGKSQKSQGTKSGLYEGWVTWVIWCFTRKLCMRRDAWTGVLSWCSCQSPVAQRCGLLNHPNSFCGGVFKLNAKFGADSLLYLLSHFEYDGHTVHMFTSQCLLSALSSMVNSSLFTCAFQFTLLGCQVTSMLSKLFSLC